MKSFGNHRMLLAGLLAATCGLASGSASAATATSNFAVTATVQATCNVSAGALAFGNYTGVQKDATSTILVTCTNSTPYDVGLSEGSAEGATVSTRQMTDGSAMLNYGLFLEASRNENWGNSVGEDTVSGSGTGSAQSLTVYGRIAGSQFVDPGSYSDTVTATVTY